MMNWGKKHFPPSYSTKMGCKLSTQSAEDSKCCVEMEGNREGEENQCMKDGRARAHPAETEQNTRGLLSTSDEMLHRDIGKHHLSLAQPKRLVALPSPQECSAFSQPVS